MTFLVEKIMEKYSDFKKLVFSFSNMIAQHQKYRTTIENTRDKLVFSLNDMVAQHQKYQATIENTRHKLQMNLPSAIIFILRPFPILLGVLYCYQQKVFDKELDEHAESHEDLKDEIVDVCRKYWVQMKTIGHKIWF